MGAASRASTWAKITKPTEPRRKIRGMLADHLIHLHVVQSSIMTAPAPAYTVGTVRHQLVLASDVPRIVPAEALPS
jgi:hypothetical protein